METRMGRKKGGKSWLGTELEEEEGRAKFGKYVLGRKNGWGGESEQSAVSPEYI